MAPSYSRLDDGEPGDTKERRPSLVENIARRLSDAVDPLADVEPTVEPERSEQQQRRSPQHAKQALLFKLKSRKLGEPLRPMLEEWAIHYWPSHIDRAFIVDYHMALLPHVLELMLSLASAKVSDTLIITALQVFDTLSDASVCAFFAFADNQAAACMVGALLAFSCFCQAVAAYGSGQGGDVAGLAMVGLKPVVDAYKEITNAPRRASQKMTHAAVSAGTRGLDIATESLPQGLLQLCVVISSGLDELSVMQVGSLCCSALVLTVVGAKTNYAIDTSEFYRTADVYFFGYYPRDGVGISLVSLGDMLMCAGYSTAKLVSLGCLLLASPLGACGWLAAECVTFFIWRFCEDDWRFPDAPGAALSIFAHVMTYFGLLVFPSPIGRMPGYFFGPHRYAAMVTRCRCRYPDSLQPCAARHCAVA
jgi:hypothetical protein